MRLAIYLPAVTRGCLSKTLSVTSSSFALDEESILSISSLSVSPGICETRRLINLESRKIHAELLHYTFVGNGPRSHCDILELENEDCLLCNIFVLCSACWLWE